MPTSTGPAPDAAVLLGERQPEQAHLGQLGPQLLVEAGVVLGRRLGGGSRSRRRPCRPGRGRPRAGPPARRRSVKSMRRSLSESQDRAGDDLALHLVGAAVDRGLAEVEVERAGDRAPTRSGRCRRRRRRPARPGRRGRATSSLTACCSSVPLSLSTDDAGCGLPSAELAATRSAVSSSASSSFSSSAIRAATSGSSSEPVASASPLTWARTRLVAPTGATPTRSLPSRNLA